MHIVIDISEEDYKNLKKRYEFDDIFLNYYEKLIVHGTPLPKNHDRLIILSEDAVKREQVPLYFSSKNYWISEVGLSNATVGFIKADVDKEEEE